MSATNKKKPSAPGAAVEKRSAPAKNRKVEINLSFSPEDDRVLLAQWKRAGKGKTSESLFRRLCRIAAKLNDRADGGSCTKKENSDVQDSDASAPSDAPNYRVWDVAGRLLALGEQLLSGEEGSDDARSSEQGTADCESSTPQSTAERKSRTGASTTEGASGGGSSNNLTQERLVFHSLALLQNSLSDIQVFFDNLQSGNPKLLLDNLSIMNKFRDNVGRALQMRNTMSQFLPQMPDLRQIVKINDLDLHGTSFPRRGSLQRSSELPAVNDNVDVEGLGSPNSSAKKVAVTELLQHLIRSYHSGAEKLNGTMSVGDTISIPLSFEHVVLILQTLNEKGVSSVLVRSGNNSENNSTDPSHGIHVPGRSFAPLMYRQMSNSSAGPTTGSTDLNVNMPSSDSAARYFSNQE